MDAPRDQNFIPTALFQIEGSNRQVMPGQIDQVTGRILVDSAGGGASSFFQTDTFTSTNNQTIFVASQTPLFTVYLSINGAIQTPNVDYTVAGSTYTLASGIPSGNVVLITYIHA